MEFTLKSQSKDMRQTLGVQCRTSDNKSITADKEIFFVQDAKWRRAEIDQTTCCPSKYFWNADKLRICSAYDSHHDRSIAAHACRIKRNRTTRGTQSNPTCARPPKCLIESACDNDCAIIRYFFRINYPCALIRRLTKVGPTCCSSPSP